MKGIILAGGSGSRLYPLTCTVGKSLTPVFDKPLVYYPLTTLMSGGIREFCLISTPQDLPRFQDLLGDGKRWGISIEYLEQPKPEGIAQAFLLAKDFIGADSVTLILGDNIFSDTDDISDAIRSFDGGATIFAYRVADPERYGVVEFDKDGKAISLEEKPTKPKSRYAVPGVYIYDNNVVIMAKWLEPSARGELEITDLNLGYMWRGKLNVVMFRRGCAWLDAGTTTSLHEAATYVQTIESRQGIKLGCPEETALRCKFIDVLELETCWARMPDCEYKNYLLGVILDAKLS